MRKTIFLAVVPFALVACSPASAPTEDDAMKKDTDAMMMEDDAMEGDTMEKDDSMMEEHEPSDDMEGASRTVMLHVSNWEFSPATIMVKQGEDVTLQLMGMEGNHGFAIPDLGINETIFQGENKSVVLPTDTPGTYHFFCNVPCGTGHADMEGTIVIE